MNKDQYTGVTCSKTGHAIKIGDKVLLINNPGRGTYEVYYGKIKIITDDWGIHWHAYCPYIKWEDGSGGMAIVEDNVYWAGE
jgi:hypothetical protein